jgi:predicted nucleic acid-binding protein
VKFWDASAIVPLVIREAGSDLVRPWLRDDPNIVLWALTRVELVSAIERRAREKKLTAKQRTLALGRIERISRDAHEVSDVVAVRSRAVPLLARHALRAADAVQLSAALLVAEPELPSLTMVVLDRRLAEAAEREGLRVLTWPEDRLPPPEDHAAVAAPKRAGRRAKR